MFRLSSTQVESPDQETAGSGVFRRFHGSSIPTDKSGHRIYPVPPETDRNLSKPAAGYGCRIPVSNSWHFSAGSGQKRRVSWGFLPETHGILLPKSSSWVASQNRSSSSSSNTSRIWNWLSIAGGKFISSSYDYYKKTEIFLSLMSVDSDLYLFFRW